MDHDLGELLPPFHAISQPFACCTVRVLHARPHTACRFRLPTAADIQRAAGLRRANCISVFPGHAAAAAASQRADASEQAAAGAIVQRGETPADPIELPEPAETERWLAELLDRDGVELVAQALLNVAKGEQLVKLIEILCNRRWGPEPRDKHGVRRTGAQLVVRG